MRDVHRERMIIQNRWHSKNSSSLGFNTGRHDIRYELTQRGKERPATKKFSALPLITNTVMKPTTTNMHTATMTTTPNPYDCRVKKNGT
mmetsp:Transcript_15180/g.42204  ORF Transcript_15180/g.42204 Transcript_15180/m.42204 type:complete len:89 (+) Transcript_15180:2785-3051(+)